MFDVATCCLHSPHLSCWDARLAPSCGWRGGLLGAAGFECAVAIHLYTLPLASPIIPNMWYIILWGLRLSRAYWTSVNCRPSPTSVAPFTNCHIPPGLVNFSCYVPRNNCTSTSFIKVGHFAVDCSPRRLLAGTSSIF